MRKAALVISLVVAAAVTAQMKPRTPRAVPIAASGARPASVTFERISQADAYKLYQENKAVFVDVRSNSQFALGHIKGALSIPGSQVIGRIKEIVPLRKTIITYCACDAEQSAGHAAQSLAAHGVRNVYALKGGINDWKTQRYPIAAGPK